MKLRIVWLAGLAVVLSWRSTASSQERLAPSRLPEGVEVLRDLPYIEDGHERHRLDLYLPQKAEGQLPLIVWIHGGAWQAGSKNGCPAVSFVGKGYAVASINYRLSQHAVFPAQIEDCKAAIRWLRAQAKKYHLAPDHVGVWGASAGGHLVALLGTSGNVKEFEGEGGNLDQSSRVQCVVDWDKDNLVPLGQSEELADALKKAGVEVKLQIVTDNGHGGPGFSSPDNRNLIEDFFDKHLRPRKSATSP